MAKSDEKDTRITKTCLYCDVDIKYGNRSKHEGYCYRNPKNYRKHSTKVARVTKCRYCNENFDSIYARKKHMKNGCTKQDKYLRNKNLKCDVCNLSFKIAYRLKAHEQTAKHKNNLKKQSD